MNFNKAANIGSKSSLIVVLIILVISFFTIFNVLSFLKPFLAIIVLFLPGILSYFIENKEKTENSNKQVLLNGASSGLFTSLFLLLIMLLIAFVTSTLDLTNHLENILVATIVAFITALFLICFVMLTNSLVAMVTDYISARLATFKKDCKQ